MSALEGRAMFIYKATNNINGKVYIGQTINKLEYRKAEHIRKAKNGSKLYFHQAILKYETNTFDWIVLRICDSIESLNAYEQYYILYFDSMNREEAIP